MCLDEYVKRFKGPSDKLTATKKPMDITKVFHLAHDLGMKYKEFRMTLLSKPPYLTYNQFLLALKACEQMMILKAKEEKQNLLNLNQAFVAQQRSNNREEGE